MANRIILNETSYFGPGAIQEIVPEVRGRGAKKVLVVTDKDLIKFKVATKVTELLDKEGIAYEIYDKIKANPTIENVQEGVAACKAAGADILVAIGGGSAIDTSKAIAIIMTNPEFADVRSLEGASPTKHKALPIIAVSTTSGTAAEVTINYVITDTERHRKFVCADPHDIPVVAIVDADMVASMPPKLCASTGMDALVHAIEGYITKGAWELTDMMHLKAIEVIGKNLRQSVKGNPKAREEMALGQYIAGMGFSNVGLGIDHSMAHPLSAVYDIPHGMACAILLAPVLKFNAPATGDRYREIARAMGVKDVDGLSTEDARKAAIDAVQQLADDVGIPRKLSELGVKEEDIPFLAKSAMADACTPGNPRDVTQPEIEDIYKSIY
ncbi:MAG: lactaldehyde reductase [Selenomonas sp.]|uniref:lactaldehyde reductase n=1 Tax=Selenomonas sp. TaxID=2053611 RepID=UPI0025E1CD08|nr:lactaldehyde reductase [Selenomonas sp.]MCI6099698.1 lactaldehyde reductase [Selenomonas sp.]MCI6231886.1 lactaldehyde reductase [Selenomonas sp.]